MTAPRCLIGAIGAVLLTANAGSRAQEPATNAEPPKFEVASVREYVGDDGRMSFGIQPGGRFTATNVPLVGLIRQAYRVQPTQIVGGPDWMETARFDIVAKAEGELPRTPPDGPPGPLNLMMQDLLADRFKLRVHRETRESPIYALTFARDDRKHGAGLRVSTTNCESMRGRGGRGGRGGPPPDRLAPGERPPCGMMMAPGKVVAGGVSVAQLTQMLSNFAGRMVVDKTGLEGNFDIDLTFTPDRMPQGGPPPGAPMPPIDPNGPSLFTALQEQLGLKLDAQRGAVEVLVIDHVERPTPD